MSLGRIKNRFAAAIAEAKEGYKLIKDGISMELVPSLAREAVLSLPTLSSLQDQFFSRQKIKATFMVGLSLYMNREFIYNYPNTNTVTIGDIDITLGPVILPAALAIRAIHIGFCAGMHFDIYISGIEELKNTLVSLPGCCASFFANHCTNQSSDHTDVVSKKNIEQIRPSM